MNHIIDPTFFYDAIERYAFSYNAYIKSDVTVNEYGMQKTNFEKIIIKGSLQTQGTRLHQRSSGNYSTNSYKLFCKNTYRLKIGDFVIYNNKLLHITEVVDYDEYGVREFSLEMTQLNEHSDLQDFVQFINGDKTV